MHPDHAVINIHFFVIFRILMTVAVNPIVFFDMTCMYRYVIRTDIWEKQLQSDCVRGVKL